MDKLAHYANLWYSMNMSELGYKKVYKNNRLIKSPHYASIIEEYNRQLNEKGKINDKEFYRTIVAPLMPGYSVQTWYQFLRKFRSDLGHIIPANSTLVAPPKSDKTAGEVNAQLAKTMMSNKEATDKAIGLALNIGAERLRELQENPQLMSAKEAVDLIFKAMKAQDSRIHAVGKIREDNREQEKFDRAFGNAAYE